MMDSMIEGVDNGCDDCSSVTIIICGPMTHRSIEYHLDIDLWEAPMSGGLSTTCVHLSDDDEQFETKSQRNSRVVSSDLES